MSLVNEVVHKIDGNPRVAYSFIRMFLGFALFIRGFILVSDLGAINDLDGTGRLQIFYSYITVIHLLGGFLIAIGLFTRIAALFQIPILFSAIFIVHADSGLMMGGQSLELASLVFFLLIIYSVFGSGPLALNNYFKLRI